MTTPSQELRECLNVLVTEANVLLGLMHSRWTAPNGFRAKRGRQYDGRGETSNLFGSGFPRFWCFWSHVRDTCESIFHLKAIYLFVHIYKPPVHL